MDEHTASGGTATVDLRLARQQRAIEANLDRLLADLPESPSEILKRATQVLGLTPPRELPDALELLVNTEAAPPLRTELARSLVLLRLLVDEEMRNMTGSCVIRPQFFGEMSLSITALIERANSLREEFGWNTLELNSHEAQRLDRLQRTLMPATDRLHSYGLLLSMVEDVVRAAADGTIDEIRHLREDEASMFRAALSPDNDQGRIGRVLIDAVALRCRIQQDLEDHERLLEAEPDEGRRREVLERLRLDMAVYNVVLERLQYQQSVTLAGGDKEASSTIFGVQRALFAVYSRAAACVRNPTRRTGERDLAAVAARERLFQEAAEADKSADAVPTNHELYLEALKAMQGRDSAQPAASLPAADMKRESRRPAILMGVAGVLAAVAATVNIALWETKSTPPDLSVEQFDSAMPLETAAPLGPVMVAKVPSSEWNAMDAEERSMRVGMLGRMAKQKGFAGVYLADESGTELALWTPDPTSGATSWGSSSPTPSSSMRHP